jgi:hypothetical protein
MQEKSCMQPKNTPKGLYIIAQGKRRSRATLGVPSKQNQTLKGFLK